LNHVANSDGDSWFLERTHSLGPIPIKGDLPRADKLLKKWDTLRKRQNETKEEILRDLWESFVWRSPFDDSRQFFALPKQWDETNQVLENGLVDLRKQQSTKSVEWLSEHGICGDNIREGLSEIPQAGRGAFATRFLRKGSPVASLPLLHIPNRKRFDIYARDVKNKSNVVGQQLMLNYCLGHRHSTMVLCPYGLLTALVNHASEPNVKLQWSDPTRSVHDPEWLNKTVEDFRDQKFAVLTMELVALRNIEKDEEIVLNYGDEWEEAWNEHVKAWSPLKGAESYVSAADFNADLESKLKTVFEELVDPYPSNVQIKFDMAFATRTKWLSRLKAGTLKKYKMEMEADLVDCDILRFSKGADGRYYYTAAYIDPEEKNTKGGATIRVKGVPREAFVFKDLPYTGDFLQPNVFRHDIRIPDELFPDKWKNLLGSRLNGWQRSHML
jgi:SET domain